MDRAKLLVLELETSKRATIAPRIAKQILASAGSFTIGLLILS